METLLLICAVTVTCNACPSNAILTDVVYVHNYDDEQSCVKELNGGLQIKQVKAYEIIKNKEKYLGCVVVTDQNYLKVE